MLNFFTDPHLLTFGSERIADQILKPDILNERIDLVLTSTIDLAFADNTGIVTCVAGSQKYESIIELLQMFFNYYHL